MARQGIRLRGSTMSSLLPESLDVAAGLVFVYLLMSLLTTIVREAIEGFCKSRARTLEKGLIELLCDHPPEKKPDQPPPGKHTGYEMLQRFYEHPLVMSLYRGRYTIPTKRTFFQGSKLPSYIPSSHFAFVVLDLLDDNNEQPTMGALDPDRIISATQTLPNARLAKMVRFAIGNSGGDLDKARQFLENWFNATMDRVSGWYKLETHTIIFWLSFVMCVLLNVNTVVIAQSLYLSPSLRKAVEVSAQTYYQKHNETAPADMLPETGKNPLSALDLPLGWNDTTIDTMRHLFRFCDGPKVAHSTNRCIAPTQPDTPMPVINWSKPGTWGSDISQAMQNISERITNLYNGTPSLGDNAFFNFFQSVSLIMGWLMTAFAVTLGAPFWFDVLSKLMTLRSTLKPKDGGRGSDTTVGLDALSAVFAPRPADATIPPAPGPFTLSVAHAASSDDADLAFLHGLDPNDRPRDA